MTLLSSLSLSSGSVLDLVFDSDTGLTAGLDWALRWANPSGGGDRVSTLQSYFTGGQLTVSSSPLSFDPNVNIFDYGDGFTYVGYVIAGAGIPEPTTVALLGLGLLGLAARRRR